MDFTLENRDYTSQEVENLVTALNQEIEQQKPTTKTDKEIAIEQKELDLLKKEKLFNCKQAGVPEEFAELFVDGVSADALQKLARHNVGYVPVSHKKGTDFEISKEKIKLMTYNEQQALFKKNPEMFKNLY